MLLQPTLIRRGTVIILSFLFIVSGDIAASEKSGGNHLWHQYYEPITSQRAHTLIWEAFRTAERWYGDAKYPVKRIILRRSYRRKPLAHYAVADIVDWKQWASVIIKRSRKKRSVIWPRLSHEAKKLLTNVSAGADLDYQGKRTLVEGLNRIVDVKDFAQTEEVIALTRRLGLSVDHSETSFWDLFTGSKHRVKNRKIIDALFPNTLSSLPEAKEAIREGFNLCEHVSSDPGTFVLYIGVPVSDEAFHLWLFHEAAHLLNPDLKDWYVEGFNNVFTERVAKAQDLSWKPWQKRFRKERLLWWGDLPPYAAAYQMMQEIRATVPEEFKRLLSFTSRTKGEKTTEHIAIKEWLTELSSADRRRVKNVIDKYADAFQDTAKPYAFQCP